MCATLQAHLQTLCAATSYKGIFRFHMAAPGTFLTSRSVHPVPQDLEELPSGPQGTSGPQEAAMWTSRLQEAAMWTSRLQEAAMWTSRHIRYLEESTCAHRSNYLSTKTIFVFARGIARFHPPRGQSDPKVTPAATPAGQVEVPWSPGPTIVLRQLPGYSHENTRLFRRSGFAPDGI